MKDALAFFDMIYNLSLLVENLFQYYIFYGNLTS